MLLPKREELDETLSNALSTMCSKQTQSLTGYVRAAEQSGVAPPQGFCEQGQLVLEKPALLTAFKALLNYMLYESEPPHT